MLKRSWVNAVGAPNQQGWPSTIASWFPATEPGWPPDGLGRLGVLSWSPGVSSGQPRAFPGRPKIFAGRPGVEIGRVGVLSEYAQDESGDREFHWGAQESCSRTPKISPSARDLCPNVPEFNSCAPEIDPRNGSWPVLKTTDRIAIRAFVGPPANVHSLTR